MDKVLLARARRNGLKVLTIAAVFFILGFAIGRREVLQRLDENLWCAYSEGAANAAWTFAKVPEDDFLTLPLPPGKLQCRLWRESLLAYQLQILPRPATERAQ